MPRRVARAWFVAAALSGIPSTVCALGSGRSPLAAVRAAGTLLPHRRERPSVVAGAVAHAVVSSAVLAVLALIDQRRPLGAIRAAALSAAIGVFDLEVVGRRYPSIAALPRVPQYLDHLAFGAIAGTMLGRSGDQHQPRGGEFAVSNHRDPVPLGAHDRNGCGAS